MCEMILFAILIVTLKIWDRINYQPGLSEFFEQLERGVKENRR